MAKKISEGEALAGLTAVEAYLAEQPDEVRATLDRVRAMIRAAAPPDATERVSYGVPTFQHCGGLVGYGRSGHGCGFYVMSPAVMDVVRDDVAAYDTSKATIRFKAGEPLPDALVTRIVGLRVAENEAR